MISNNLKKINFSKNLSTRLGFPLSLSKKIIDDLIIIYIEMIKNNNLVLKNIGSFKLVNKKERLGRNPKTNEEYLISERKSIKFIVSKNLSKIINKLNG